MQRGPTKMSHKMATTVCFENRVYTYNSILRVYVLQIKSQMLTNFGLGTHYWDWEILVQLLK